MDIQESSLTGIARSKGPEEFIFKVFTEPKIQNLASGGHHGSACTWGLECMNHVKLCM